jgi:hypothetical protein
MLLHIYNSDWTDYLYSTFHNKSKTKDIESFVLISKRWGVANDK